MPEWKPIEGHDSRYEVCSDGRIRRCGGRQMGQWANSDGYMMVRLSNPRAQYRVHRLVALAFVPNPNGAPIVNHLDHDRANNTSVNLEWCTQTQNLAHAAASGRMQRNHWCGKRSPNARLTNSQVQHLRKLYATGEYSWESLGKVIGVSKRTIGRVVNSESYSNV